MEFIFRYFDLASQYRRTGSRAVASIAEEQKLKIWPQYLIFLAGVVIQPYFQSYANTGNWDFKGLLGWVGASCIIGVIALPAIYKSSFDATKPVILQFIGVFVSGLGWESIVGSAIKIVHHTN